jgi:hypothetical protein
MPTGIILAVGNNHLITTDTGNAIARRLRVFETALVSNSRIPLLSRVSCNTWNGPLSLELSGIFHWVLDCNFADVENYMVRTYGYVPSFKDSFSLILSNINSVYK